MVEGQCLCCKNSETMNSMVSPAIYIYIYTRRGPVVAQIVITFDHDREKHRDHNRMLSLWSASVCDERLGTYLHVPDRPNSGNSIVMIVSDPDPIVDSIATILSECM